VKRGALPLCRANDLRSLKHTSAMMGSSSVAVVSERIALRELLLQLVVESMIREAAARVRDGRAIR
jgi:hypothetical protein